MTPAAARASYRKGIGAVGETVTIRRYSGLGSAQTYVEKAVKARVVGFAAGEIVPGIVQGERRVILLAEDIGSPITLPLVRGDKLVVRGAELEIEDPDDSTRRIGGELIAYELRVVG